MSRFSLSVCIPFHSIPCGCLNINEIGDFIRIYNGDFIKLIDFI
jgi:hypothetical protein